MYQTHRFSLGQAGQGLGQVPEWHFSLLLIYISILDLCRRKVIKCLVVTKRNCEEKEIEQARNSISRDISLQWKHLC